MDEQWFLLREPSEAMIPGARNATVLPRGHLSLAPEIPSHISIVDKHKSLIARDGISRIVY